MSGESSLAILQFAVAEGFACSHEICYMGV